MHDTERKTTTELDAIFDAFEAIDGIARAMLTGSEDHIPLAKGIQNIAGALLERVDSYRESLAQARDDKN